MIDVLGLPFDQYQRYRLVADLLGEVRPRKDVRWRILDVGGRTALLRPFLPRDRVTLVDLEASAEPGLVRGDGSRLPFADRSFDVVCAFDTLEHVPPGRRRTFVSECRRVARTYVVIAGPYASPPVDEAERVLQSFLKDKLAVEHRYLEEHRHHGLPSRAEVEAELARLGAKVASVGHGSLERWLALMCLSMYMDYVPELRGIAGRFYRFYNRSLYESDQGEPVYRHAVVAALDGAPLPAAPARQRPRAPAGALARITDLAFEVIAFDREREAWKAERRRLRAVVRTLEADLAGHRTSLSEVAARRAEQAEVIRTLESDLEGHRSALRDVRADLEREIGARARIVAALEDDLEEHRRALAEVREQAAALEREVLSVNALHQSERQAFEAVRGELERLLGEHRGVVAALERDLQGHRAALRDVRGELEETRRLRAVEAAALAETIGTLERDLSLHEQVVVDVERDLSGHRQVVATLRAESSALRAELERALDERNNARLALEEARAALSEREARIELLRSELRDRWRSLKRALLPRKPTP